MKGTAIIVFAMLLFAGCGPLKVTEFYIAQSIKGGNWDTIVLK